MNDNFALLHQPRQPWLDPLAVQQQFIARSAESHPDRLPGASPERRAEATERFASLNGAAQCLRDPKQRLRHLLELEHGAKLEALERLPSAAVDEYFKIGQVCREVDQFLARRPEAGSPLLRVQFFGQSLAYKEQLEAIASALQEKLSRLEERIKALNPAWEEAPAPGSEGRKEALPLDELEEVYRELSYVLRWSGQVRERIVRIAVSTT